MVEIIYDSITKDGAKHIVEYWGDKNSLPRFNFLKSNSNVENIEMRHLTLIDYLKKYAFRD